MFCELFYYRRQYKKRNNHHWKKYENDEIATRPDMEKRGSLVDGYFELLVSIGFFQNSYPAFFHFLEVYYPY